MGAILKLVVAKERIANLLLSLPPTGVRTDSRDAHTTISR